MNWSPLVHAYPYVVHACLNLGGGGGGGGGGGKPRRHRDSDSEVEFDQNVCGAERFTILSPIGPFPALKET